MADAPALNDSKPTINVWKNNSYFIQQCRCRISPISLSLVRPVSAGFFHTHQSPAPLRSPFDVNQDVRTEGEIRGVFALDRFVPPTARRTADCGFNRHGRQRVRARPETSSPNDTGYSRAQTGYWVLAGLSSLRISSRRSSSVNPISAIESLIASRIISGKKAASTCKYRIGSRSANAPIALDRAFWPPVSSSLFNLLISAQSASVRYDESTTSKLSEPCAMGTSLSFQGEPSKPGNSRRPRKPGCARLTLAGIACRLALALLVREN